MITLTEEDKKDIKAALKNILIWLGNQGGFFVLIIIGLGVFSFIGFTYTPPLIHSAVKISVELNKLNYTLSALELSNKSSENRLAVLLTLTKENNEILKRNETLLKAKF